MNEKKNYPLYEVVPFKTIDEMLRLAVADAGEALAFRYKDKSAKVNDITYRQFFDDTLALGEALLNAGIDEEHIACVGDNSYNWVTVYLTVLRKNAVFVPVDKDLPEKDMLNVLVGSDSKVLFYNARYEEFINRNLEALSAFKLFIGFDRATSEGKFLSYKEFIKAGGKLRDENRAAGGKDCFARGEARDVEALKMIVYTSGTTGIAKGVMLSEKNIVSGIYHGLRVSTVYKCCLSVLPYNHTYEGVCGLLVSLHKHSTICINDNLRNTAKNLQFYKPDFIIIVPALAEVLYNKVWTTAEEKKLDGKLRALISFSNKLRVVGIDLRKTLFKSIRAGFGGNLRKVVSGGAPIRPEIGEFFDAIGIDLINGYGITECSPLVCANRDRFNDFRTVGVKLPCIDLKLINETDTGEGEICVRGDVVMLGYYKNPKATAEAFSDGWFLTGDYGKFNALGQLLITGRKKNVIVLTNGKNIYPEEIEEYIQRIPLVSEVVVSSFKDDLGNDSALCAEIYPNAAAVAKAEIPPESLADALKKEIKSALSKLPSYKQVTKVVVRETEFEKTTTRKIKRTKKPE